MSNAGTVTLGTLTKVFNRGSYSNTALNSELVKHESKPADKASTTEITYGTIQYKIFLECRLKPSVKTKLRNKFLMPLPLMSAYQYFSLEKVSANTVFDEANKLAKKFSKKNSGSYKLINGILRALERQGKALPSSDSLVDYLSIKESFPKWLVEYLLDHFGGDQTKEILVWSNQPAANSIRTAAVKGRFEEIRTVLKEDGLDSKGSCLTRHNLNLSKGGVAQASLLKGGKITARDAAASLTVGTSNSTGNEQVLDACSAPGERIVQTVEKLTDGNVIALDTHKNKLRLVKNITKKLHVSDKVKTKASGTREAQEYFTAGQFDKILVDAPCSGLGLMRRKPKIRYEKSLGDIKNLARIQLFILEDISGFLAPSRELVYSTCMISLEEDEGVAGQFLKLRPKFDLVLVRVGKLLRQNTVRVFPSVDDSDGFFITKLKRRE